MSSHESGAKNSNLLGAIIGVGRALAAGRDKSNISTDTTARISIYRMLLSLVGRNVNARTACFQLYNEISIEKPSDRNAKAFCAWYRKMDAEAVSFSDAIAGWIPEQEVMLIRSGESGGSLEDGLRSAYKSARTTSVITSLIMKASTTPAVLTLMAYATTMIMATQLLPSVVELVPVKDWPAGAIPYLKFATFVADNAVFVSIMFLAVIAVIMGTLTIFRGKVRSAFDAFPPWSLHRRLTAARFLDSFSGLLGRGAAPFEALLQISSSASPYLEWHISRMLAQMAEDGDVGSSLTCSDLFDMQQRLVIKTTSDDSSFPKSMADLSDETVESVSSFVNATATAMQYAFIALIGLSIAWAMGSVGMVILEFYQSATSST